MCPCLCSLGFLVYKFIQKVVKEYVEAKRILDQNPDCVQGGAYFLPKKGKKYQLMPLKEELSAEIS